MVERAAVLCKGKVIEASDFPGLEPAAGSPAEARPAGAPKSLAEAVEFFLDGKLGAPPSDGKIWDSTLNVVEDILLRRALSRTKGVRLRAAELLGIHRNTLRKKLDGEAAAESPAEADSSQER